MTGGAEPVVLLGIEPVVTDENGGMAEGCGGFQRTAQLILMALRAVGPTLRQLLRMPGGEGRIGREQMSAGGQVENSAEQHAGKKEPWHVHFVAPLLS